ncbi:MAG: bifunctional DNA-binding transcriptional regulator/O6-methylguanine-DNA methyltransferase Ada [Acidobacteriota bacterium]
MNEKQCLQKVLARDSRSDGAFVYGVRSTGVYCRPSCPSRRPAVRQIVFFPQAEQAERAGFRACRRCHPKREFSPQMDKVRQICRYIEERSDETPTLAALGRAIGGSPFYLQRIFKQAVGVTPKQYHQNHRIVRLKKELQEAATVTAAQFEAGYGSSSRLYEQTHLRLGMTPATYRRGGGGVRIHYTVARSPMGRLLVAATERGLCSVMIGDQAESLESLLRAEFPAAEIRRDSASLRSWVDAILSELAGHPPAYDLPLDIRASAFQSKVWKCIRSIPRGSTRSYSDLARSVGRPRAVRAVAHACARNPVALVIPCHRVVAKDGGLAGYRWGVQRKRLLLERELRVTSYELQTSVVSNK